MFSLIEYTVIQVRTTFQYQALWSALAPDTKQARRCLPRNHRPYGNRQPQVRLLFRFVKSIDFNGRLRARGGLVDACVGFLRRVSLFRDEFESGAKNVPRKKSRARKCALNWRRKSNHLKNQGKERQKNSSLRANFKNYSDKKSTQE